MRVGCCREVAGNFVQEDIYFLKVQQNALSVNFNHVILWIDMGGGGCDRLAIDFDLSRSNQLLGVASRSNASLS
jgi:hypothetical protein